MSPRRGRGLFKFKAETSPLILTFLSLLLSSMSPSVRVSQRPDATRRMSGGVPRSH